MKKKKAKATKAQQDWLRMELELCKQNSSEKNILEK